MHENFFAYLACDEVHTPVMKQARICDTAIVAPREKRVAQGRATRFFVEFERYGAENTVAVSPKSL